MIFDILYCRPCGYHDRAHELAAVLRDRFDVEVTVGEGKLGQFDVFLDGELVASKGGFWKRKFTHSTPPQAKILEAIEKAVADRPDDSCEISQGASGSHTR